MLWYWALLLLRTDSNVELLFHILANSKPSAPISWNCGMFLERVSRPVGVDRHPSSFSDWQIKHKFQLVLIVFRMTFTFHFHISIFYISLLHLFNYVTYVLSLTLKNLYILKKSSGASMEWIFIWWMIFLIHCNHVQHLISIHCNHVQDHAVIV